MKRLVFLTCVLVLQTGSVFGQPLSGNFTVGGNSPDFATLQDVANALKTRGVSGPVFINIRPGTYVRQGAPGVVIRLDTVVAGVSPTNRITFQPDVAAGGNPGNVILQIDCDISLQQPSDRVVMKIGTDYLTLRNLTFRDADSLDIPAAILVFVNPVAIVNPTIEGLVVEGCTFIGTRFYPQGQQFGTDLGLYAVGGLTTARVSNNHYSNLLRAVSFNIGSIPEGDTLIVEDNRFDHIYFGFTGTGNPLGTAIEMTCAHPFMRRNMVTQSSGSVGITVLHPLEGIIENNYVQGNFRNGQIVTDSRSGVPDRTQSLVVRNNIVLGSGAVHIRSSHVSLFHNTIVYNGPVGSLDVIMPQCVVVNNIILSFGGFLGYDQIGATGLVSDHNVLFSQTANGHFIRTSGGQIFETLAAYQSATGLDVNSHFTDVAFTADSLGIHLDECGAQDPALNGIPLSDVPFDFYGALRDSVKPFVGAVEGVRLPFDMFASPFRSSTPGFAVSIAKGLFDNATLPGIAVPDYDHRQVFLYHNNGVGRTFTHTGTLATGFRPVVVRFFDVDNDGNQDLVVAGDTNAIGVFWGDGVGGFSGPATVGTWGTVRGLEQGTQFVNFGTIVTVESNGPHTIIGYVMITAGRVLCHDVQHSGSITHVDTLLNTSMQDFVVASVTPNPTTMHIVAPGIFGSTTLLPKLFVFDVTAVGDAAAPCPQAAARFESDDHEYNVTVAPYINSSAIVGGDFDGDGDNDFITTGFSDTYCVIIRNQGGFSFTSDTIATTAARGIVALDYENDGDLDFVTVNRTLDSLGITVFLNDGSGHFTEKPNCHFPFATGTPNGVVAADFDLDGKTDLAVVSRSFGGADSLYVLYNIGGFNGTTGVTTHPPDEIPPGFDLMQNYPNPFNPATRIQYSLPSQSHVTITIFNILGQEITRLVDKQEEEGNHTVEWKGTSSTDVAVSSGVYFYRVEARRPDGQFLFAQVKKMLLVR